MGGGSGPYRCCAELGGGIRLRLRCARDNFTASPNTGTRAALDRCLAEIDNQSWRGRRKAGFIFAACALVAGYLRFTIWKPTRHTIADIRGRPFPNGRLIGKALRTWSPSGLFSLKFAAQDTDAKRFMQTIIVTMATISAFVTAFWLWLRPEPKKRPELNYRLSETVGSWSNSPTPDAR